MNFIQLSDLPGQPEPSTVYLIGDPNDVGSCRIVVTSDIGELLRYSELPYASIVQPDGTTLLTSTTAWQHLFDANAPNGEVFVEEGRYAFHCNFSLGSMSATSGNCGFGIRAAATEGATFGSAASFTAVCTDLSTANLPAAASFLYCNTIELATDIAVASTGTGLNANIHGVFRVNTEGFIVPSVKLTTAAAANVRIGSSFVLHKIHGSNTSNKGKWR